MVSWDTKFFDTVELHLGYGLEMVIGNQFGIQYPNCYLVSEMVLMN